MSEQLRPRPRSTWPWLAALMALLAVAGIGIAVLGTRPPPSRSASAEATISAPPLPRPQPTARRAPSLPVEQQPLPREALPEGKDIAAHVSVEERAGFTVYRFSGPLAHVQPLDLDLGMGALWVGTSLGLLRHDPRTGSWRQWDETAGLPGERLDAIAVVAGRVIADSSTPTTPGNVRGTGVLAFDVARRSWTELKEVGRVWDLWGGRLDLVAGAGRRGRVARSRDGRSASLRTRPG